MKKYLVALGLLLTVVLAQAQTILNATATSTVIDSSGMKYPAMIWQKMIANGDYWLRNLDPKSADPRFLLTKTTDEQKLSWYLKMPRPADSKFFKTGQPVKPFKIKDVAGNKIETKDWAGKTVVLNFWFIGCPPCRAEIPDLNKLALKYKNDPNVIFVAIALDEDYDVKEYTKKNPLAYRLIGDGGYLARQFDISLYPTNVVIDKQGKVALHYSGGYLNGPYWIDKMIKESGAL